jgi:hypothetical protein
MHGQKSSGEVRSMLCLKERRARKAKWPANLKSEIENLKSLAESCSRQLREIKDSEDSLRFYFLDEKAVQCSEHHGVGKPLDLTEPLIL